MADSELNDAEITERGEQPSLVESFGISGLHGYRSISLSSPYAATVLIAKNGSGKTTLLGALDAFLKGQFSRLRGLQFDEIRCKLRGVDDELVLHHDDMNTLFDVTADSELFRSARKFDVDVASLLRFLFDDFDALRDDYTSLGEDAVFSAIVKTVGYRHSEAIVLCDRLRNSAIAHNPRMIHISTQLKTALNETEIVYLPTYRRIELPLLDQKEGRYRRKRPRFRFSPSASLHTGDIQFGLSDILDRLSELNQTILAESNLGYRQISANIINELIDGTFERETFAATEIPDKETLSLFFSRLKEGRRVGPFSEVTVPNIDRIYADDGFAFETKKTLRYFLGKLDTVIQATRDIEVRVEDFINSCNKYLSSRDISATIPGTTDETQSEASLDSKILRLNRRNLKVHAESVPSGRKIPLDALSSGEKQMVSLFAKLYLYPKSKIVLIDEPELSLSLDWQRHILADVVTAPLCRQVIAITHSPFVFDNALEPFARSLRLAIDVDALARSNDDEGDLSE